MKLFPTRKQWRAWRWTTKLTAVGVYIAIVGVIISVVFWLFPLQRSRETVTVLQSNSAHNSLTTGDHSPVINVVGDFNIQQPAPAVTQDLITPKTDENDDVYLNVYNPATDRMERVDPEEGKFYRTTGRTGCRLKYMVTEGKVFTEYTSPDGKRIVYNVTDMQGNVLDYKFPYPLSEHTAVIPRDLELRRSEKQLPNGWKHVHVDLKWNGGADLIYDPSQKLQAFSCTGGFRTNHKLKRLIFGNPEKTTKYDAPNKPTGGDVRQHTDRRT